MTSSYIEKLIWRSLKAKVLGGFSAFARPESIPLDILLVALPILVLFRMAEVSLVTLSSVILLIFGAITIKHRLSIWLSSVASALALAVLLFSLGIQIPKEALVLIVFFWFTVNSSVFIYQAAEFFASTGGLVLLYGSDENRMFLSPLPEITIFGATAYSALLLLRGVSYAPIMACLAAIISMYIARGKVLRSAIGIYAFLVSYYTFTFVSRTTANVVYWAAITLFSALYIAQSRAKGEKGLTGFMLLNIAFLISIEAGILLVLLGGMTLTMWQNISMLALFPAPFIALGYALATHKVSYYLERGQMDWKGILVEVAIILGKKVAMELVRRKLGL